MTPQDSECCRPVMMQLLPDLVSYVSVGEVTTNFKKFPCCKLRVPLFGDDLSTLQLTNELFIKYSIGSIWMPYKFHI